MSDLAFGLGFSGSQLESFGQALIERFGPLNLWTAALLVGALVIDHTLSRRARASFRIALYAPLALRILLPLGWSMGLATGPRVATIFAPLLLVGARPDIDPSASQGPTWRALVAVAYVAVATLLAARMVLARMRLGRSLADAEPVPGHHPGVPCPILQHEDLGPMVVGIVAPRIVLPRRLLAAGEEHALSCVLRHELAHLGRRDGWLLAAMQFLCIAAWPVVPLWIAIARVRQLVELACDEAALAGVDATERRRYGHALLDMVEWRLHSVAPLGAGELHFGSTLRARIEALASQRHWPLAAQTLALSLASIALLIACSGAAPPDATAPAKRPYGYEFRTVSTNDATSGPAVASSQLDPSGRLPPEVIEGNVRANFGDLLACYQTGLAKDPKLAGTVSVRFVLGEGGMTNEVTAEQSTLPDNDVVSCVVGAFRKLTYPESRGGNVTVVYPIEFAPPRG